MLIALAVVVIPLVIFVSCRLVLGETAAWCNPAKTNLQDHARFLQDCATESCMQDLHGTCTRYVPFLARFLHYLARSCTYLARNGARFCKRCCKNNYLQVWSFLHHFLQDMCKILHDSARIVQEKGHIACTCHASLACKILAQSCMILQVCFCWESLPAIAGGFI